MRIAVSAGVILLALVVTLAAMLLIRACGVRVPITGTVISACPDDSAAQIDARLASLEVQRAELRRGIKFLEQELAQRQCIAEAPPQPEPDIPQDGFDPDAFRERDVSMLEGCWDLDSSYSTTNIRTGRVTNYTEWQMCFDAEGRGRQTMRGREGARTVTCESDLEGRFLPNGNLLIDDLGRVPCNGNMYIFRRETSCSIDADGQANCSSRHPERANSGSQPVEFRRATLGRP